MLVEGTSSFNDIEVPNLKNRVILSDERYSIKQNETAIKLKKKQKTPSLSRQKLPISVFEGEMEIDLSTPSGANV